MKRQPRTTDRIANGLRYIATHAEADVEETYKSIPRDYDCDDERDIEDIEQAIEWIWQVVKARKA